MAAIETIMPIADLRGAIGGVGDSEDAQLTRMRTTALRCVEQYTNRNLLDREFVTFAPAFCYMPRPSAIEWRISDIKPDQPCTIGYAEAGADPGGSPTQTISITPDDEARVSTTHENLIYYAEANNPWANIMRFDHPVPSLTAQVGMTTIPSEFQDAIALIVRAIYDGSAYDSISNHSILAALLKHYKPFRGYTAI